MVGEQIYRGKLKALDKHLSKTNAVYLEVTLDDKMFRYFEGDADHMEETFLGLKPQWNEDVEVVYTERVMPGKKWPYRNIKGFNTNFTPASELKHAPVQEKEKAAHLPSPSPAGATTDVPEETITDEVDDVDVQLYRKCIRLAALAWQPQLNDWKEVGVKLSEDALFDRIGQTASSIYISKKKER